MSTNRVLIIGGTGYEINLITEKLLGGGKDKDFIIEVIPEETLPLSSSPRVNIHCGISARKTILEEVFKEGGITSIILNINPWLLSPGDPGYKLEMEVGYEAIDLAVKFHAEQFIYVSFMKNFLDSSFFLNKNKIEDYLLAKDIPLMTVLKPGLYMETISRLRESFLHANTFCQPLHATEKLPLVSFEDVARVVSIVCTNGKQFHKAKIDLVAENLPVGALARSVGFEFKEISLEDIPFQYREIYNCFRTQQGRENIQVNDLKNILTNTETFEKFLEKRHLLPAKDWNKTTTCILPEKTVAAK